MNIIVFFSGSGTNLKSIIDKQAHYGYKVIGALTNNPDAGGVKICNSQKVDLRIIDHKNYSERDLFDQEIDRYLHTLNPDYIILAGFMRILGKRLVDSWEGQIINIHPSLLPKYKGIYTHQRALDNNEKFSGCTVHYVNSKLDSGKIILQKKVKILKTDNIDKLAKRILKQEHLLYPKALKKILTNR